LATTKTGPITKAGQREMLEQIFYPIVKKELLAEFMQTWDRWLVLTDAVEDQKCPGKLKIEFSTQNGEMIALAPKSYYMYCRTEHAKKDGRKGIPKSYPLSLIDFFNTLYGETVKHSVEVRSLRLNRDKQMTRTTTVRSGLTGIHVKLSVSEDRVTCRPLQFKNSIV